MRLVRIDLAAVIVLLRAASDPLMRVPVELNEATKVTQRSDRINEHFAALTKKILTVPMEKAQLDKGIGYTLESTVFVRDGNSSRGTAVGDSHVECEGECDGTVKTQLQVLPLRLYLYQERRGRFLQD